jgi:hypothetical protein
MAMRGNSQRSNCGMRRGGMAKMRNVGGVKAPMYGSNSSVMSAAKKDTSEGKVGMGGIGADGVPVKSSLSRPGRKAFKTGGRVGKKDGGPEPKSPPNPGEVSDEESSKYLRGREAEEMTKAMGEGAKSSAANIAGALMGSFKPTRLLGLGAAGYGVKKAVDAIGHADTSDRLRAEADKFDGKKDKYANGGKLTAAARDHIKTSNFALPGRRYPIEDASHARNALARVSQHGSSDEKAKVRSAVHRKYPGIGKD